MKQFLVAALAIVLFAACRKKDDYVYPTKKFEQYDNYFLTHFGNQRLFTRDGEITNAALVALYVNEHSQFFYTPSSVFADNQFKTFSLVNEDSLINTGIAPVAELKRTLTDTYDKFSSKYKMPANDTNVLALHIGKYKMFEPTTTPLGYTYFEVESPGYILKKVNDTLFFPIVRYITTSTHNFTFSFTTDKVNNVFDPNSIKKLGAKDTLLIQTFDIGLRKKKS